MTRLLIRLHTTLRARLVEDNPAALMVTLLMYLYAFGGLLFLSIAAFNGVDQSHWSVLAGMAGIGTLAFLGATLIIPSGENALRPAAFSVLPVTGRDLLPAMAWASLLTRRGVLVVLCSLVTAGVGAVLLFGRAGLGWSVAWVLAIIVAAATTLLLAELAMTVGGGGGRAKKESANLIGSVMVIVFIFGFSFLSGTGFDLIPLDTVGAVLAWTPFAAAPGAVISAVGGAWGSAVIQTLIAVATVIVGFWCWGRLIDRQLDAPLDALGGQTAETNQRRRGSGEIPLLLPGMRPTAGGFIYSRVIRYLRRDSRMLATIVTYPIMALFFIVQGVLVDSTMIYLGIFFTALLGGTIASNDFGYDGPANWVHMSTGVPARTVLLARHAAYLTPMAIALVVISAVSFLLAPDRGVTVLVVVAAVGMFATGAAFALLLSTYNAYATSRPGTNPWADKSGYSGPAFISAFAMLLLGWIPSVPGIAAMLFGYQSGVTWVLVLGVILALAVPAALYAGAVVLATRRVEQRYPEIFAKVHAWVN